MQQPRLRTIRQTVGLFTLLLATACGGDGGGGSEEGGGGSASGNSGVAGSKSVADTTTEDVQKLCRWMATTIGEVDISDEQSCVADALDDGVSKDDCASEVAACAEERSMRPDSEPDTADCDSAEKPDFGPNCAKVTVKDFETCVSSLKNAFESYINSLSCAENAGQELSIPRIAACDKIYENCPEIPLPRPEL